MSETFAAVTPGPHLSAADHALLVRTAWSRARLRMYAALAVIGAGAVVIGALALLFGGLTGYFVAGVCLLVLAPAIVTAVRMPRQADGLQSLPLMSGADSSTRRQVLRAVRRGTVLPGRLGVLADDCAMRIVRRRGVPVTYAVLAVGMLAAAGLSPVFALPLLFGVVVLVGGVALAGAAASWVVLINQARRYLVARAA